MKRWELHQFDHLPTGPTTALTLPCLGEGRVSQHVIHLVEGFLRAVENINTSCTFGHETWQWKPIIYIHLSYLCFMSYEHLHLFTGSLIAGFPIAMFDC